MITGIHIDFVPVFKVGDLPPAGNGYNEWHEWAEVQYKGGLRQKRCPTCKRFFFPQEVHACTARRELAEPEAQP